MGNEIRKQSVYNGKFNEYIWVKEFPNEKTIPNVSSCVKTEDGLIQALQYILQSHENQQLQDQCFIYTQRASSISDNLVNIFTAQYFSNGGNQAHHHFLKVRTEKIFYRLSQMKNLTLQESLYILEGSCNGFSQILCYHPNFFQVSDQMIGVNQKGRIKVWFNSNFAKNEPELPIKTLTSQRSIFHSILDLIELKCQNNKFPLHIKNTLFQGRDLRSGAFFANTLLNLTKQLKKKIGLQILLKNLRKSETISIKTEKKNNFFDIFKKNLHQMIYQPKTQKLQNSTLNKLLKKHENSYKVSQDGEDKRKRILSHHLQQNNVYQQQGFNKLIFKKDLTTVGSPQPFIKIQNIPIRPKSNIESSHIQELNNSFQLQRNLIRKHSFNRQQFKDKIDIIDNSFQNHQTKSKRHSRSSLNSDPVRPNIILRQKSDSYFDNIYHQDNSLKTISQSKRRANILYQNMK